ncbi:hypothetical protein H072_10862 [Dactylellina haptotyla CBS 200.50]|uniref:Annexin n=1 Tax=Dactylellina haptotyla (strain CBS 200.50) TaxID=1284197 RepID=S7ZY92_DACHA|nr:hypothetical protein H072_10862 [Dactylellina haptotyla CBS 200.50]
MASYYDPQYGSPYHLHHHNQPPPPEHPHPYPHPHHGQYPQPHWDPSNGGGPAAYQSHLSHQQQPWQDPSTQHHHHHQQPHYNYHQQQPLPPPIPPHPSPSLSNVSPAQAYDWNQSSYHDPSQAPGSLPPPPHEPPPHPPPPYDPSQRPMSWPSSPQEYHTYFSASNTAPTASTPSYLQPPPPASHGYFPPSSPSSLSPSQSHGHGHHHSISGPITITPRTSFPGYPSTHTPRSTDLAMDDAQKIRDAFGIGGLHHTPVINIIANRSPCHLEDLLLSYKNLTGHDLLATLKDTARANKIGTLIDPNSKHFNAAATAILLGPVKSEGYWVVKAVKGTGTNEALLTEAIFGRSNQELEVMRSFVRSNYYKTLEEYVRADVSMGTKDLFDLGMEPSPSKDATLNHPPPEIAKTQLDVRRIVSATPSFKLFSKNSIAICQVLAQRTPGQILAIRDEYRNETGKNLRDTIKQAFYGHVKDALLYILDGAVDKVERDVKLLEDAMEGAGTRNQLLISRLVRIHWDKHHLAEVKKRYYEIYRHQLLARIRKEVRGSYRDLMVSIAESDTSPWRQ